MADKKISALPASTTPLAGTEVLPIVQGGATTQVSVVNLTAGRAISATQLTLTTGNLIVANGQGIDFSATPNPSGMTSELFADYEEGTWAPIVGGTATYLAQVGTYTKVGRLVFIRGTIFINAIGTGNTASLSGLPYTAVDANPISVQVGGSAQVFSGIYGVINGTSVSMTYNAALATSNQTAANIFTNFTYVDFSGCYSV